MAYSTGLPPWAGDGIGPEVVDGRPRGAEGLRRAGRRLQARGHRLRLGLGLLQEARRHDAGRRRRPAARLRRASCSAPSGAPDIPDHITLWGLRLAICQPLDQYANVRPTRILPGITSPLRHVSGPELDWVIVRENSEGEYAGVGGRVASRACRSRWPGVSVMTRAGVQRIMRYAFALAQSRPRKLLTVVTKSNAQRHAHGDVGRDRGRGRRRNSPT